MAQPIKCLLCKPEELNSILSSRVKELDVVVCACDISTVELKGGASLGLLGQPASLIGEIQVPVRDSDSNKIV